MGPSAILKLNTFCLAWLSFFFIPPTRNLGVNILPVGFRPAAEMRQRGEDTLSQRSPSSSAGCLSRGRQRGREEAGGGRSGSGPINLPVR